MLAAVAFAFAGPDDVCVTWDEFVAAQTTNGRAIGIIHGSMALGLTLISSILGMVSFAHGECHMIGGMPVCGIPAIWFPWTPPWAAIAFALGAAFERIFLTLMYRGKIDRPVEYGILVTFDLAFMLQYLVQAVLGANPVTAQRFFDCPRCPPPPTSRARSWRPRAGRSGPWTWSLSSIRASPRPSPA